MKKINFQDLPNTDTPIKGSTLNTMQSNIEESCVAVSPTQPETNEKVWIQKGKNLFNKNGLILEKKRLDANNNSVYTEETCFTSDYIEIFPNKDYSLQGINAYHIYNESKEKITQNFYGSDNNDIITTNSNAKYIRVSTRNINQLMVAQGSTATEYEAYIEPKIWCKNDNGVFEEFKKIEDTGWIQCTPYSSDIEFIDWSPLQYRKIGKVVYISGAVKVTNPTWNKPITQLPYRFAQEIDSICRTTDANNKISTVGIAGSTGILSFLETSVDSTDTSTTPVVFINISVPVAD